MHIQGKGAIIMEMLHAYTGQGGYHHEIQGKGAIVMEMLHEYKMRLSSGKCYMHIHYYTG